MANADKILGLYLSDQDIIRFVSKINYVDSGCWEFDGYSQRNNYQTIRVGGKTVSAHRLSYHMFTDDELWLGSHIDHLCRNTCCVNPEHLEQVEPRVNILRGKNHVAERALSDRCSKGHSLLGDNLYVHKRASGDRRVCRECMRGWQKDHKERKKAAN